MRHVILISTLLFASVCTFAQLGTPLTQYSSNQMLYNPATIGMSDALAVNISMRKQWIQIPGSPTLASLSVHAPTKDLDHALGVMIQREEWGPMAGNFGYLNYAYKMHIYENTLSLGLQAGVFNSVVDWNKVDAKDPDQTMGKGRDPKTNFDVNVGLYWLTYGYYLGFSIKHLMPPKINFDKHVPTHQGWQPHPATQFYLMSGYEIKLDRDWSLRPEWFMRYVHHTPMAINLGVQGVFQNRYFLGTYFQTGQNTVSFTARGFVTDYLRIGYSYNVYFAAIQAAQQGTHEISINYQYNNLWERKGSSFPRW